MKHARTDGVDPHARSRARRRALQAVYAWQIANTAIGKLIEQFRIEDLVRGVEKNLGDLDTALASFLDRDIALVDPIERAVLRIAAYELRHRPDVPYRVVINEAIETTKRFGSEHGHTYVNGVLDHAAAQWRSAEAQAPRRS